MTHNDCSIPDLATSKYFKQIGFLNSIVNSITETWIYYLPISKTPAFRLDLQYKLELCEYSCTKRELNIKNYNMSEKPVKSASKKLAPSNVAPLKLVCLNID